LLDCVGFTWGLHESASFYAGGEHSQKNHEHSHLASWAQIEVAQAGAKDSQA
jgi:hypothetical protein